MPKFAKYADLSSQIRYAERNVAVSSELTRFYPRIRFAG